MIVRLIVYMYVVHGCGKALIRRTTCFLYAKTYQTVPLNRVLLHSNGVKMVQTGTKD
jgi:hypothetical protein